MFLYLKGKVSIINAYPWIIPIDYINPMQNKSWYNPKMVLAKNVKKIRMITAEKVLNWTCLTLVY
jgi:hypothetical protein